MSLINLGHFHVLANDLNATKDFYCKTLGLEEGYRPPFEFSGAWLYLRDFPVLQLAQHDEVKKVRNIDTGFLHHIAFNAESYEETKEHLQSLQIPFTEDILPETQTHQIFFKDPNGVTIELTFLFN